MKCMYSSPALWGCEGSYLVRLGNEYSLYISRLERVSVYRQLGKLSGSCPHAIPGTPRSTR
jgi:hypothetical protein